MSDPTAPGQPGDPDSTGANPPPPADDSIGAPDAAARPVPPDAQPTQAYPPAAGDAQPTQAYPASGNDPTQAYQPGAYAGVPQQYPGQPGYDGAAVAGSGAAGAAAYGGAGGPGTRDTRPRTLAIAALIAAAVGALLTLGGFIPAPGVATVLVVIGGILLLAGFVLSLIALISKKHGGKGLSITALVVSIIGGILFFFALVVSLVWIGLANAAEDGDLIDPGPTSSALPSQEASEAPSETPSADSSEEATPGETPSAPAPGATGTYDEAAYLAAVRPEFVAILQEIQPGITEAELAEIYPDDVLISIGQTFAELAEVGGVEEGRQSFVESTVTSSNGAVTEDQANRLFDTVSNAASAYLVQ